MASRTTRLTPGPLDGARYIDEREQLRNHEARIQALNKQLMRLLEERDRDSRAGGMDELRKLVAELYGQAASYANLIILAGYAGAFATWQFVDKFLSPKARFISAILLLFSLFLFIGWEVWKMVAESWRMRHLSQALNRVPPERRLAAVELLLLEGQLRNAMIWQSVLIPTITAGFLGGAVLIAALTAKLCGYQFLP